MILNYHSSQCQYSQFQNSRSQTFSEYVHSQTTMLKSILIGLFLLSINLTSYSNSKVLSQEKKQAGLVEISSLEEMILQEEADFLLEKGRNPAQTNNSSRLSLIKDYRSRGYRAAVIPTIKEEIFRKKGQVGREIGRVIEESILMFGSKSFEGLSSSILKNSSQSSLRYVLAKKMFAKKKFSRASSLVSQVKSSSLLYPMGVYLQSSINYLQKNYQEAYRGYSQCMKLAENAESDFENLSIQKSYELVKNSCAQGKARAMYGERKFERSLYLYLDVPKTSIIWPGVLLEEAWASYYKRSYNQTLGKLVTYKSPHLNFFTNPEVSILRALSYMRMCLFDDATQEVDRFYKKYAKFPNTLRKFLTKRFSRKVFDNISDSISSREFLNMHRGILKDPLIRQVNRNLKRANLEIKKLNEFSNSSVRGSVMKNLRAFKSSQESILSSAYRSKVKKYLYDLVSSLKYLSFIKLEILNRKKQQIYASAEFEGKRGDVKYLSRNNRQYFWKFIGEFWGDELGDYVFALPSMCGDNS